MSLALILLALFILVLCYALAENSLGQVQIGALLLVTLSVGLNVFSDNTASMLSSLLILVSCLLLLIIVLLRYLVAKPQTNYEIKPANFASDLFYFSLPIAFLLILFGHAIIIGDWSDFRHLREDSPVLIMLSTCLFYGGVGSILAIPKKRRYLPRILIGVSLLFLFVLVTKEKIFLVPIVLASAFDLRFARLSLTRSAVFLCAFFILYFFSTAIRWYGSFEDGFIVNRFLDKLLLAYDAGFERNSYLQFALVMDYFHSNEYIGPNSPARLLILPLDKLLGTGFAPDNPMYLYSEISKTSENSIRSSAHPTIYGDFYGQIGLLMIAIPAAVYLIVIKAGFLIQNNRSGRFLAAGLFLFIALITRGSSFYAFMYLAVGFVVLGLASFGRTLIVKTLK